MYKGLEVFFNCDVMNINAKNQYNEIPNILPQSLPLEMKQLIKYFGAMSTVAILSGCMMKTERISSLDPFENITNSQKYMSENKEKQVRPSDMNIFLEKDALARKASGMNKQTTIYNFLDSGLNVINNSCRSWFKQSIVYRTKINMNKNQATHGFNFATAIAGILQSDPRIGGGVAMLGSTTNDFNRH